MWTRFWNSYSILRNCGPESEVLARPTPVPKKPGFYAWYFDEVPAPIPLTDCVVRNSAILLYIGIAPKSSESKENLRTRLRYHMRGNAYDSTLRLSLGCLLAKRLGIELRRTGKNQRATFGPGEINLCDWLAQHAQVTWHPVSEPWRHEQHIIRSVSLPLNLEYNEGHPFYGVLSDLRSKAKKRAKTPPVWGA